MGYMRFNQVILRLSATKTSQSADRFSQLTNNTVLFIILESELILTTLLFKLKRKELPQTRSNSYQINYSNIDLVGHKGDSKIGFRADFQ